MSEDPRNPPGAPGDDDEQERLDEELEEELEETFPSSDPPGDGGPGV